MTPCCPTTYYRRQRRPCTARPCEWPSADRGLSDSAVCRQSVTWVETPLSGRADSLPRSASTRDIHRAMLSRPLHSLLRHFRLPTSRRRLHRLLPLYLKSQAKLFRVRYELSYVVSIIAEGVLLLERRRTGAYLFVCCVLLFCTFCHIVLYIIATHSFIIIL